MPDSTGPSRRLLVGTDRGDTIVIACVERGARARVVESRNGFRVETARGKNYRFRVRERGKDILQIV